MEIVMVLVPASLLLALVAIIGFVWAVRRGQFDDLTTPAIRLVVEDDNISIAKEVAPAESATDQAGSQQRSRRELEH